MLKNCSFGLLSAIIIFSLLFTSCSPSQEERGLQVALEEARYLIDQRDYTGAIQLLSQSTSMVATENEWSQWRLVMASAYVGRSGVDLISLSHFVRDLMATPENYQRSVMGVERRIYGWIQDASMSQDQKRLLRGVLILYQSLFLMDELMSKYEQIPKLPEKGMSDLKTAIRYLEYDNLGRGGLLYRASLRLIDFRQSWSSYFDWYNTSFDVCSLSIEFEEGPKRLLNDLKLLISDLRVSFGNNWSQSIEQFEKQLDSWISGLNRGEEDFRRWLPIDIEVWMCQELSAESRREMHEPLWGGDYGGLDENYDDRESYGDLWGQEPEDDGDITLW